MTGVLFSRDGRTLVTAGADKTVRFWNVRTHRPLGPPLLGHTGTVLALAVSPDDDTLATGGADDTVRLWNARGPTTLGTPLRGRVGRAEQFGDAVAFSRDGNTVAAASSDGAVHLWSLRAPGEPGRMLTPGRPPPRPRCTTTRVGGQVARACVDVPLLSLPYGESLPVAGAFAADGRTLATVADDGRVRVWNARTGTPSRLLSGVGDGADSFAFSRDSRMLAVGSTNGLRLWNLRSRRLVGRLRAGIVYSVAFSPDGRTLATGGADSSVRLWDVATHHNLGRLRGHTGAVSSVAFSPDGGLLAAGGIDKTVRIWDVRTRAELGRPFRGASGAVWSVAFSPSGNILAAGNGDRTVRLWDVGTHNQLGKPLGPVAADVLSVAFSPDGRMLASSDAGGTVRVWKGVLWRDGNDLTDQVCGLVSGNLTKAEWDALAPGLAYRKTCAT